MLHYSQIVGEIEQIAKLYFQVFKAIRNSIRCSRFKFLFNFMIQIVLFDFDECITDLQFLERICDVSTHVIFCKYLRKNNTNFTRLFQNPLPNFQETMSSAEIWMPQHSSLWCLPTSKCDLYMIGALSIDTWNCNRDCNRDCGYIKLFFSNLSRSA